MFLCNVMVTPDGTSLVPSRNAAFHTDTTNGEQYMIDGYTEGDVRVMGEGAQVFSLDSEDDIELIREHFHRYNSRTREFVKYKDMESSWLRNISTFYDKRNQERNVSDLEWAIVDIANRELSYRRNRNIDKVLNDE